MSSEHRCSIVPGPRAEGGFTAIVPALPEVVTEGDAEDEAVRMADDAIQAVLDYRRDHGLPIPDDAAPTPREVRIAVAE